MHLPLSLLVCLTSALVEQDVLAERVPSSPRDESERSSIVSPKVMIVSMFEPEAEIWHGIPEFDLLARNVSLSGLSPLFPTVHCTADGEVCQVVTGEGEINAASTIQSLVLSSSFKLTQTYFLIAGIAGISPEIAPTCSVTFARFAVQVALQYEISQFELPANYSSGYIPFGAKSSDEYPSTIYGTEVFEFNADLQHQAAMWARQATLNDSETAMAYRANYASSDLYAAGTGAPGVYECDVATSDVYYSGTLLSTAFSRFTALITNGTGTYCTSAQEDNATGEALLRAAIAGLVDFSRIIVMRTASDFDRPYPGQAATDNLFYGTQGAFEPAVKNLYLAGIKVVEGILGDWNERFGAGVKAGNYVGDIFGSLGGRPDFGPYADGDGESHTDKYSV